MSICTRVNAGKFLKYFIFAMVASNLALAAWVLIGGMTTKEKPATATPAASTNSTNSSAAPEKNP
ncbi:MAG TPA: hypothetical protein VH413_14805 [Verrucomicrobiae bacterium]|nr:hypothetical protein [Verrucomicrobiae bacterium]